MRRGCACSAMREPGWANPNTHNGKAMRRIVLLLLCTVALAACRPATGPVTIMAASSLQDVVGELTRRIESEQGVSIRVSYAASSTLARQIQAGAPADIFLSADARWMDELGQRQQVDAASRSDLLTNALVIIAGPNVEPPAGPARLADALSADARLALADPAHVPAGRYARDALQALGIWDEVVGKVVYADNVRAALALVARGEAAYGIVYRTDVALTPSVRVAGRLAASQRAPIRYSFAVLATAPHPQARNVFEALIDKRAQQVFRDAGFALR